MYSKAKFEQIYKEHYRQMYRLAYCMLEDPEEARDIVSQVFTVLWENKPQVKEEAIGSYLMIATRNQCLHALQRQSRKLEIADDLRREMLQPADRAQEQLIAEVQRAIAQHLTPQDRRVLELHFGEEMTYKEAALELGISASAVNKHITQSLSKLRAIFKIN